MRRVFAGGLALALVGVTGCSKVVATSEDPPPRVAQAFVSSLLAGDAEEASSYIADKAQPSFDIYAQDGASKLAEYFGFSAQCKYDASIGAVSVNFPNFHLVKVPIVCDGERTSASIRVTKKPDHRVMPVPKPQPEKKIKT